jgi:hypothetical protein
MYNGLLLPGRIKKSACTVSGRACFNNEKVVASTAAERLSCTTALFRKKILDTCVIGGSTRILLIFVLALTYSNGIGLNDITAVSISKPEMYLQMVCLIMVRCLLQWFVVM